MHTDFRTFSRAPRSNLRFSRTLVAALLLAIASDVACSKNNTVNVGPGGEPAQAANKGIGPAGGAITNAELGATLTIDANVLTETVAFTIAEARPPLIPALPSTLEAATRFISFEPADRTFARDVRIAIDVPAGELRLYRLLNGAWTAEPSAAFTGGQARLSTRKLGAFVVAKGTPGPGAGNGGSGGSGGVSGGGQAGAGGAGQAGVGGVLAKACESGGCEDNAPFTCSDNGEKIFGEACGGDAPVCVEGACAAIASGGSGQGGAGGMTTGSPGGAGGGGTSGGNGGAAIGGSGGAAAAGGTAGGGGTTAGCVAPELLCGGGCVPVQTSQTHCGKCDNPCGSDQTCSGGTCVCTGGKTLCGMSCADTLVDASNCGACGSICDPGVACQAGHCASEWALWKLPGEGTTAFSYQVFSEGYVLDKVTTLQWQQPILDVKRTWADAQDYCAGLVLAGRDDWRVPNVVELQSLVDYGVTEQSAIDAGAFPNTPKERFWTATLIVLALGPPVDIDKNYGWFVSFEGGEVNATPRTFAARVRCVR